MISVFFIFRMYDNSYDESCTRNVRRFDSVYFIKNVSFSSGNVYFFKVKRKCTLQL